jgi:hypothetical protein
MYHKALFEKVAAAIDFNQMAPEQTAAFRQGTAANFNSKSWLDRNKMYRKMQGEADWADNTKARAMGSNFQYNAGAPTPSASPSNANTAIRPLSPDPEFIAKGRPFGGQVAPAPAPRNLPPTNRAAGGNSFWDSYSGPKSTPAPALAPVRNVSRDQRAQAQNNPYAGGRQGKPAPAAPAPVNPEFQQFFNRAMMAQR